MTQVGCFRSNSFVHCKKRRLCGPSVLPGLDEGGHLSPNRGELSPSCVGVLFMRHKEAGPQCAVFGQSRKLLQLCSQNLSEPIGRTHYARGLHFHVVRQRKQSRQFTACGQTKVSLCCQKFPLNLLVLGGMACSAGQMMLPPLHSGNWSPIRFGAASQAGH